MLIGVALMARFGTGVDLIEQILLLAGVVARFLIALHPVGELDGDLDVGIDRLGGLDDEVFRDLLHQCQAELLPGSVALGLAAIVAGAVGEEEIVNDKLIVESRDVFHGLLQMIAHPVVAVAVGVEQALTALVRLALAGDGGGDAAGHFNVVFMEQVDAAGQLLARNQAVVAIGLEIHLVYADVFLEEVDLALQGFHRNADHGLRCAVDHGFEILKMAHMPLSSSE